MSDSATKARPRVGVISLGCSKNLVDTEVMLGHLDRAGCDFVQGADDADVILVNTCSFIGPAREESIQTILEAAERKKDGKLKRLVVAGCMVQRYAEELQENLPEVDAFVGLDELHRVVDGVGVETPPPTPPESAPALSSPALSIGSATTPRPNISDTAIAAWGPAEYLYDHDHAASTGDRAVDRVRQDLRGLRSHVRLLCDPRVPRVVPLTHNRVAGRGGGTTRRWRRARDQPHRPGLEPLRPRS